MSEIGKRINVARAVIERYAKVHNLQIEAIMNYLQMRGIVSDNCIKLEDVALVDLARAVEVLNERK